LRKTGQLKLHTLIVSIVRLNENFYFTLSVSSSSIIIMIDNMNILAVFSLLANML